VAHRKSDFEETAPWHEYVLVAALFIAFWIAVLV
jgi:hypothetical protein